VNETVDPRIPFHFSSEALAGTIYGVVTAMAVYAALAGHSVNIILMAGIAFGTSLALALTYIYAHWLAGSYADAAGHAGGRKALQFELPTLIGPALLGVIVVIEKSAGVSTVAAAESTMWIGTVMLFILGYRIALLGGRGYRAAVGFGLLDASIGASLVLVKVLIH
jgi:secreted trypsin-like serine protease